MNWRLPFRSSSSSGPKSNLAITILKEEDMYTLCNQRHNPPQTTTQFEKSAFQDEIKKLYDRLVESLSEFGDEGDYYGVSDYTVRPDLRERQTVIPPPAPEIRQFLITIIKKDFYYTNFIQILHGFLANHAQGYQVVVGQDFEPKWYLKMFATRNSVQIYCTDPRELARLIKIFSRL